jgi:wobble nucleotide-excising tRNase
MKPESPGGKTQFKLTLQLPGGGTPAAILSEGEQRAIAIASFMAKIQLGKGRGGIVLDDPVSGPSAPLGGR